LLYVSEIGQLHAMRMPTASGKFADTTNVTELLCFKRALECVNL
jgi:hypothetical protein